MEEVVESDLILTYRGQVLILHIINHLQVIEQRHLFLSFSFSFSLFNLLRENNSTKKASTTKTNRNAMPDLKGEEYSSSLKLGEVQGGLVGNLETTPLRCHEPAVQRSLFEDMS